MAATAQVPREPAGGVITLPNCLVSLINSGEAQVPAKEAGALTRFAVVEGQEVREGDLLAQIDDSDAQAAARVAQFKLQQAQEEANSDVSVRYSTAASAVAKAEYEAAIAANAKMRGTVPQVELNKLLLTWKRADLEIEKAQMDLRISGLKAKVSDAEAGVAKENVIRRQIRSPLDGIVVELRGHQGEWVKPGDTVVHVVRLDKLRIEAFLNIKKIPQNDLLDKPIRVSVEGGREALPGKIVFVSPMIQAGGDYRIWADVDNRLDKTARGGQGNWLLKPGMTAEMTIQVR